ncbi:MAG: N-acetyl-gamma-glutamyl-phosphate reductase [Oscillospiraceae bacterium]|nr:N-acetyl-gamma-glutamyl-phosphate reductase [Oscillospiraceae bacterium]
MIKVGILGATGYAGIEVVRLLSRHSECELTLLVSQTFKGQKISDVYQSLRGVCDLALEELDVAEAAKRCDVVFTALPHGASKEVIPSLYAAGLKVIDLSGDFRYNDVKVYEEWYGQPHSSPELLNESVYGLCELHREEIKKTKLVGNPGCYTTCSILGLAPLVKHGLIDNSSIIIDAKSGVSGAGRGLALDYHFCECTENMKAYKLGTHRHTSEIEQELGLLAGEEIRLSFSPHLVPMKRGIFATCYANLKTDKSQEELVQLYKDFYEGEYFVRVYDSGELPESNHVSGSNFVDIGLVVDKRLNRVIVVSAIDNLVKGAAGQAVQNMNLMFGLDEKTGLMQAGLYL